MADFASIPSDASTSDTHVPALRPAPRHRDAARVGTGQMAHLVDLTPADLADGIKLVHALDVTTSFDGLRSLLGDIRLLNKLGASEDVDICLGQAIRLTRLLGGEVA